MIKKVAQELLTQQDIICLVYNGMDNVFQRTSYGKYGRSNNCKTPCHYKNKKENLVEDGQTACIKLVIRHHGEEFLKNMLLTAI